MQISCNAINPRLIEKNKITTPSGYKSKILDNLYFLVAISIPMVVPKNNPVTPQTIIGLNGSIIIKLSIKKIKLYPI